MIDIHECPVCNGGNLIPYIQCVDHSVSHETFTIKQCPSCTLLITTPRPTAAALNKYYDSSAYTSHIGQAQNVFDKVYQTIRNFTLRWKLSLVKKRSNFPNHTSRLLDFGCGTGEFLKLAKSQGWKTTGMEPSGVARDHSDPAISKDIRASLEDVISRHPTFDVITLWHVLEHVEDLNTTFKDLKNILAQNGTIFIAVPNHASWDAQHYKEQWAAYDVPRHLWHFTTKNMEILASRHGMRISKIIPMRLDAYYITLLSEKYRNNNVFSLWGLLRAILNALSSNLAARKNREYSSLIYVLKK
jgi:2-polyprenyl-3-methyl-5-hydroxy-6-metoxy-1,4-benzoquinol methylase